MSDLTRKLQQQTSQQWHKANEELQRVLRELGAQDAENESFPEMIRDIRKKNPSFRELMLSLDAATYDARKRLSWNAHMTSAYIMNRVEASYTNDLKPMVANYRQQAGERLEALMKQLRSMRERFQAAASEDTDTHR
ncbi:hypothetical protein ACMDCT_01655 [Halomonadaceae bacterium KBTZ08]